MAHFRGGIRGQRGEETRLGSKQSGLRVFADGWNFGVTVNLDHVNGKDVASIYLTGGSNMAGEKKFLGRFDRSDLEK